MFLSSRFLQRENMSKDYIKQKKSFIAAACFSFMLLAGPAFAADAAPAAPPAAPAAAASAAPSKDKQQVQADRKAEEAMRFDDHKKEMLKSLDDRISETQGRISEMQKMQSCIKDANDAQAMHSCFPDKGQGWRHGEGDHHGDGKWERHGHEGDHSGSAPQPPPQH
jgi:hypothetical protein